jgi:hypothetical protein
VKTNVFTLSSKPGVKRDGTDLDNEYFQEAQWVRFQRGRAKKMGGYRAMSSVLTGPIRNVVVHPFATNNLAHVFNSWGVQRLEFDVSGAGGGVIDRTPSGYTYDVNANWQSDAMFNSGGGGGTVLVCAPTSDLDSIASSVNKKVYSGLVNDVAVLTPIADGAGDIQVSGGCCVLQPFLFVYGNDGLIKNSNANDFSIATGWSGTNANEVNVDALKIVKGLPVRGGGNAPAGLFWALGSLIRVSFVGGTALWKYDPVSTQITVLSKSSILEYDGVFFWPGVDRFYMYTGVVQELPNAMSLNFFFDNLNYAAAQKVWALKVPRYGEIWWFFPSGNNTECDSAVIFNIRENTWYDTRCARTAGYSAQVFRYPVAAGEDTTDTVLLTYAVVTGAFAAGQVITGGTSGAVGTIVRCLTGQLNIDAATVSGTFQDTETITNADASATGTLSDPPQDQQLTTLWQHEYGRDKAKADSATAIEAYFETNNFQWATGGPVEETAMGANVSTRITKVEPDFLSSGEMEVVVKGRGYANSAMKESDPFVFDDTTQYISMREQRREIALRVRSNVLGGHFEAGRVLITVEPGDERAA